MAKVHIYIKSPKLLVLNIEVLCLWLKYVA